VRETWVESTGVYYRTTDELISAIIFWILDINSSNFLWTLPVNCFHPAQKIPATGASSQTT